MNRSRFIFFSLLVLGAAFLIAGLAGIRRPGSSSSETPIASEMPMASESNGPSPDVVVAQASTANQNATLIAADLNLHPAMKDLKYDATIRQIARHEDPVVDGWQTERFNELAGQQLKNLGKLFANTSLIDRAHLASLIDRNFAGRFRPSRLHSAFSDEVFHCLRSDSESSDSSQSAESAAADLATIFVHTDDTHFKFKIIRVELIGDQARTRCYFQMSGWARDPWRHPQIGEVRRVQVNATWDSQWADADSETPKLIATTISDYEELYARETQLFVDCTESQLQGIDALREQLVYGRDHWYGNLESSIGVEGRGNGLAIGDANGDGLDDLYVCQPAALPNKLFLRMPNGGVIDASAESGVDWLDSSRGALFIDVDNDGDQDLVVAINSDIVLHENAGNGRFSKRLVIPTNSRLFSINAVDYDRDGDLDLYVCGYSYASQIRPEDIFASPMPYHDANNGAENWLLQQDSPWAFSNVTEQVGLHQNNLRFTLASTWDDMDGDGDLDLYIANDFGRNNLYRNDGGMFVDVAEQAGVEDIGPGMSCSWGDYDNDGLIDLYVSNMFSSAGSRITHNAQFKREADAVDLAGFQRHARGNTLFKNNGDGTFTDQAISSGTLMGRWAWGSLFVDINNDGWRDIYVTNGFVTADNNNDL